MKPIRMCEFFCAVLLAAASFTGAGAAPPVWHVVGPHAEITLFGSVHLLSQQTNWRTPALDAALARADAVWFEIPFDAASQAAASEAALRRGILPAGQTLTALLTPSQRTALAHLEAAEGLAPAAIDRFRPWLADTTLSIVYFQKRGADASLGVEEQIAAGLPPTMKRGAFETAAEQIGFFADLPLKDQIDSLDQTLTEIDDDPGVFDRLSAAWARGDVAAVDHEAVEKLKAESPGVYQRLVVDRNRRWVDQIQQLLRGDQRIFIVVGVGHLVGPDSVPALLRARGVRVEGP
jgi:uncharacterized protein YbaP (TraB family)